MKLTSTQRIPARMIIAIVFTFTALFARAQSITGTWQLTEEKTCFKSSLEDSMSASDTEKELAPMMGSSASSRVARLIRFDDKGKGEEGIFTAGKKKGSSMEPFRYKIQGNELQFLDKKSGMITKRFIIDELTSSSLRFHDVAKDCETRAFTKVK